MRIHLAAPTPHRDLTTNWEPDAYVGKSLRLCRMLTDLGHHIMLYSGPENDAPVGEHVTVVTAGERRSWFGDTNWRTTVFNEFDPMSDAWATTNNATIEAIRQRIEPADLIFLTMGAAQQPIRQAFPAHVVAEPGCGYEGILADTYVCFESEAWRHYQYGRLGITDGRYFDTVIPNFFDPADYRTTKGWNTTEPYLLFMGRLTERKGLQVVTELAQRFRVLTAGQGDTHIPNATHWGVISGEEKARVIAEAAAVLCPTSYIEPGGGIALEAMISGVPVIASPWGCFSETVRDGVSGWKCSTLTEYIQAADEAMAGKLAPQTVQAWAHSRFTLEACAPQYDRWIHQLASLYSEGWYA